MTDPQHARFDEDVIEEPPNSTVDDWLGQQVARDDALADEAMQEADGDTERAEEIFEQRRSSGA